MPNVEELGTYNPNVKHLKVRMGEEAVILLVREAIQELQILVRQFLPTVSKHLTLRIVWIIRGMTHIHETIMKNTQKTNIKRENSCLGAVE